MRRLTLGSNGVSSKIHIATLSQDRHLDKFKLYMESHERLDRYCDEQCYVTVIGILTCSTVCCVVRTFFDHTSPCLVSYAGILPVLRLRHGIPPLIVVC